MSALSAFLLVVAYIQCLNAAGTIHFWAIRHVESTHNAKEDAPTPPGEKESTFSWKSFDAPPSSTGGIEQLEKLDNFGKIAVSGPLGAQLAAADAIQFYSSDLCRSQLTALVAQESLLTTATHVKETMQGKGDGATDSQKAEGLIAGSIEDTLTKKAKPFVISQYLRERYDGWNVDAKSRFSRKWRQSPTDVNEGKIHEAYKKYLFAALPEEIRASTQLGPLTNLYYQGKKFKENPKNMFEVGKYIMPRIKAFGKVLQADLLRLRDNKKKTIIAGVHGTWLDLFVQTYGGDYETYKEICAAIGKAGSKFRLGNGEMIDIEIQIGTDGSPKIVGMTAYDLQGRKPAAGATIDAASHRVSITGVNLADLARFESFGDEYDDESSAMVEYNDGTYFDEGYGQMPEGRVVDESESMMVSALIALDVALICALICIVCCAMLAVYGFVVWKMYDSGNKKMEYQNVDEDVEDVM